VALALSIGMDPAMEARLTGALIWQDLDLELARLIVAALLAASPIALQPVVLERQLVATSVLPVELVEQFTELEYTMSSTPTSSKSFSPRGPQRLSLMSIKAGRTFLEQIERLSLRKLILTPAITSEVMP